MQGSVPPLCLLIQVTAGRENTHKVRTQLSMTKSVFKSPTALQFVILFTGGKKIGAGNICHENSDKGKKQLQATLLQRVNSPPLTSCETRKAQKIF